MNTLNDTALEFLRRSGREVSFGDGEIIVRRGSRGDAFYVVLEGVVEVLLEASDGRRLPLTRLGKGATFGEMSLLTDEEVSADVLAGSEVKLLEYPSELFQAALTECVELRNHILSGFCASLRETNVMAWRYFQRSEVLDTLMHAEESAGELAVESQAMRRVEARIGELAGEDSPVLLVGDAGVGKLFVARKIHEAADPEAPLVVVDCSRVEGDAIGKLLFGPSENWEYLRRSNASGALPLSGALDLADRGTLILRHVDAMPPACREVMGRYAEALDGADGDISPHVRLLATTRKDIGSLVADGAFSADLGRRLLACRIDVPSLSERKRDILPLARLFLAGRCPDGDKSFNKSAENVLVSAQFRHRNVAELREAVEFGALFADGHEIGSEHIFIGPRSEAGRTEYDLSPTPWVRWILTGRRLQMLSAGVLGVFAAIAAACLVAGDTMIGRIANGLVWGVWWPFLMAAFLLMGRLWCTVCPIALIGRTVRRLGSLDLTPPSWLKKYSGLAVLAGFATIVWTEHYFKMIGNPAATGWLLVSLIGGAAVLCIAYQREAWCRYVCPLGALGAGYSASSMMRVRANPSVCAAQCTTHECFKGSDDSPGCSVFHHPMYARGGQHCKMCLKCLSVCPHGSARLYLRPPLQGLWGGGSLSDSLSGFALAVFFMSLVMLASHKFAWVSATVWYTGLLIAAACAGLGLQRLLRKLFGDETEVVTSIAFALLVLGSGPLMAFHLQNVPLLDSVVVSARGGGPAAHRIGLLELMQAGVIAIAACLAAIAVWRIRVRILQRTKARRGWLFVDALAAIYVVGAFAMLLAGGDSP